MTETVEKPQEQLKISSLLAELIGTFALSAAVIRLAQQSTLGAIGIALILTLLIVIFAPMSGAHLNPAITIALLINKKVGWIKALAYIIAQLVGALLALLIFHSLWKAGLNQNLYVALQQYAASNSSITPPSSAAAVPAFAKSVNSTVDALAKSLGIGFINVTIAKGGIGLALFTETLGSAVFGLGVGHAVYAEDKPMLETGLSIGIGLLAALMIGGSTVVLNPAVAAAVNAFSINPATSAFWIALLVYALGTCVGMYIGITAYRFLREKALAK